MVVLLLQSSGQFFIFILTKHVRRLCLCIQQLNVVLLQMLVLVGTLSVFTDCNQIALNFVLRMEIGHQNG
jgi:hypothetical protein